MQGSLRFRTLLWPLLVGVTACDGVFSLGGRVHDERGKPISGALVVTYGKAFPDSGLRTRTDSAGSFRFFEIIAPFDFTARVEIDKAGHNSATTLIPKALEPHRIVVTLRPSEAQVASDVRFEDPGTE
jgi:hypothetical protein